MNYYIILEVIILIAGMILTIYGLSTKEKNSDGSYSIKKWKVFQAGLVIMMFTLVFMMVHFVIILKSACSTCQQTHTVWYEDDKVYRRGSQEWGETDYHNRQFVNPAPPSAPDREQSYH